MAAVNMQMIPSHIPVDYMGVHSRSTSVSSSSSHSGSRPQSSHGALRSMAPTSEDLYRASLQLGQHSLNDHTRHLSNQSHSSAYSLASTDLGTPADSPPNHNIMNPALKGHLRPSHIRARAAASPYHRDADIYSSSSETEDVGMYLANPADFHPHPMFASQHMQPTPEAMHTAGAFGRMTISPDQALEKLAANVRAATTTSAADRAKQIFVQAWLTANYTPYPDGNVPRQGLYFSYRRVCDQYGIPHINTATLGKAIRLCFPTIKTRRLGVRGNSKYHYCGIRPATSAEAEFLQDYIRKSNNNAAQQSVNAARNATEKGDDGSDDEDDESEGATSQPPSKRSSLVLGKPNGEMPTFSEEMSEKTPTAAAMLSQAQAQAQAQRSNTYPNYAPIRRHPTPQDGVPGSSQSSPSLVPSAPAPSTAGQAQSISVRHLPHFPNIEEALGSGSSAHNLAAREVWGWFQDHLDALLESIRLFRFDQFEMHVRTFWPSLQGVHRELVHAPAVAGLMNRADAIVYDEILEILRSQMLSPIPPASLASLRQLADKMEKILLVALESYGSTFVEPKVELGARFGHLVLRFLDIYQVTQALNTVLTSQKQLAEMRRSWSKVDFESVRNQSALVCNCRHEDLVHLLENEFVHLLENLQKSAEPVRDVMTWADKCCERLMGGGRGEERSTMSSRSVLIRWGYVTSQVMRDLTIRSDPAFGAFQILKLFLDDWIAVNVLRSVALSTNSVAASVEPVMQQQFFALSPMPGQESFSQSLDVTGAPMMAHTPTTSSMLAALQADTFPAGALESPSNGFNASDYGLSSFMDTTVPTDDSMPAGQAGLSFGDYSAAGAFDVAGFASQDLGIGPSPTSGPSGEPDASAPAASEQPELQNSESASA
ncbi:hypothetical protein PUNSTDRAFT_112444 [Punctularia strigosozonata HHB-11173 SS5]|uniref:uncharacterized protein n=1 Tax=Punctularia strigosozonata (strain HHB-11173) TaxID=741275 RepID=UPI0004416F07|nr:uncharacterized protein PUNSTDRAFT_112444 [Punctularia strigosozonata HHB-11173 SS5]EIN10625.1 hypothetical protein PUNSTDRAFT_112444 [Punctularia strigosozonata HHB-11173 SS5]